MLHAIHPAHRPVKTHRSWLAPLLAGALALPVTAQLDPAIEIAGDQAELTLPTPPADRLSRLEASSTLNGPWIPLARSSGGPWQPLFPEARAIIDQAGTETLADPLRQGGRFYRVTDASAESLGDAELAARFLQQATFGPTTAAIDALVAGNLDFDAWIDAEIAKPATYLGDVVTTWTDPQDGSVFGWKQVPENVWYHAAIEGDDQLRLRMAWALAQVLVTSANGVSNTSQYEIFLTYYDLLIEHALGNYRDLLGDVTYSPLMGEYLTYDGNRKAQGAQKPDENYAREVMQLFTIGLWELNPDGTLALDPSGEPIPTYDNGDIETFARVFTGLYSGGSRTDPMKIRESDHDSDEKVLLDGTTTLPAGQTTAQDLDGALDHLFNHPNTGPFLARLLIQRLTCSNPSPSYIERVADAFADNGSGVRGDLAAVARAILTDPEAREPVFAGDDAHGKSREPVIRVMHLCRAFSIQATGNNSTTYRLTRWNDPLPHYPFQSPSVFNFYLPDHQPPGAILQRQLFAPEFQIMNDATSIKFMNALLVLVTDGLARPLDTRGASNTTGKLDYTEELALAGDAAALIDHLDLLLTAGRLTDANRQTILDAVEAIPAGDPEARVIRALRLFVILPEFGTIY